MDISSADESGSRPVVAVSPAGDAIAAWTSPNGADPAVIRAASRPAGASWQTSVDVSVPVNEASEPRVGIDAEGNATALWILDTPGSGRIVQAAHKPVGEGWQTPKNLSALDAEAYTPELAVDADGNAVAVWRDDSSGQKIQAASRPSGWGWLPAAPIPDGSGDVRRPQVALTPTGHAVAIWIDDIGSSDVVRAASRDQSGTWETAEAVTTTESVADPGIATDDAGSAFAIWQFVDGIERGIQAASWSVDGSWKGPVDVSAPDEPGFGPAIAAGGNGDAIAIWTMAADAVVQTSRWANEDWQPPVDLTTPGAVDVRAQIEVSANGDGIALWLRRAGNDCTVQAADRRAGAAWGDPISVSAPISCFTTEPSFDFGLNADGDAIAVWNLNDNPENAIQAAVYDRTDPELRSLSIPAAGKLGEQLSFSVSPFDAFSPLGATTWSFGDGASATGNAVTHVYSAAGDYTVTAEATDAFGNASSASGQVTVSADPTPPAPTPPAPTPPAPPPTVDAKAKRQVEVKRGTAILKLRCPERGACEGVAKLGLKGERKGRKGKKRPKAARIGKKRIDLDAGEKGKVRIKLNRKGRKALRRAPRGRLKAKLSGSAVKSRSVVLKRHRRRR